MKNSTVRVIYRFEDIRGLQSATYQNVYLIDYSLPKHVIICMRDEDGKYETTTFCLNTLVEIQLL